MKDGYCIQGDLLDMRIAVVKMAAAFSKGSFFMGIIADNMPQIAALISRYELDRAYFAAGGLSDLALMQGQPF